MVYYEKNPKKMIQVDAPDYVLNVEDFKMMVKEDEDLTYFVNSNPYLKKIKEGEGITSEELLKLEQQLGEIKPGYTIENVQRTYKIDFFVFIHKILKLKQEYDPQVLIEREFDAHIILGSHHYNSEQIKFLQVLKKVFARTKHIE